MPNNAMIRGVRMGSGSPKTRLLERKVAWSTCPEQLRVLQGSGASGGSVIECAR
jgi:hypothetical protein